MDCDRLRRLLERIDGRSYPAYRDLKGRWELGAVCLSVDHVQGDPFAAPSRLRLWVQSDLAPDLWGHPDRRLAAEDWLLRRFAAALGGTRRGSGCSGVLEVLRPGPEVVERSALRLHSDGVVEVRFRAGLPARGRRVLGRQAWALLHEDIATAAGVLCSGPGLQEHVDSVEAQRALRRALVQHGLVGFVADGAVLPRRSGVDQAPLPGAVPFHSPASLRVSLSTSHGEIVGMGIPEGVTLIVGGGFHGKSTLLRALQRGHLDHIPGDGRERVVARTSTVKVRAEDGRRICGVDISAFLGELPDGRSTTCFHTDDASGSTSQAAAMIEAVESGAEVLLLDEDTSATNLLVRDARMRALIPAESEPIKPFVECVRALLRDWGVSTVMVVGGVGDYLAVADTVIAMERWQPRDVTQAARALVAPLPEPAPLPRPAPRVPLQQGLAPGRKTRARDDRALRYGDAEVDLTAVEQVLGAAHATTLGHALRVMHGLADGSRDLRQLLDAFEAILDDEGVEALSERSWPDGALVRPRRHEVAAALSRLRSLRLG